MSKCVLCGRELLTGDVHWEQGLCNECYNKTKNSDPYFDVVVDKRKIQIREKYIEDLEQQLAEKDEELERQIAVNKEMDKIIGEKDKEIEVYNNYFKSFGCKDFSEFQELIGLTKISANDKDRDNTIRKQVCDEIMEELKENVDCYFEERKCNSPHSQLPYIWFNEIRFRKFLDRIEKGE